MEYYFREFSLRDPPSAGAEEIYLCPRTPVEGRLALASLVLEQGLVALLQGPGPQRRLVIQADPTLDDMLAATLVERLLQGQPVAAGFQRFAAYGANVREGLKATDLPLSDSLEGTYLVPCRGDERTWETDEMVNGALTGAVLEAIQGKRRAKRLGQTRLPQEINEGDPITLQDVCRYAEQRVKELADGGVAVQKSRGMMLDYVPASSVRTIRPEP